MKLFKSAQRGFSPPRVCALSVVLKSVKHDTKQALAHTCVEMFTRGVCRNEQGSFPAFSQSSATRRCAGRELELKRNSSSRIVVSESVFGGTPTKGNAVKTVCSHGILAEVRTRCFSEQREKLAVPP